MVLFCRFSGGHAKNLPYSNNKNAKNLIYYFENFIKCLVKYFYIFLKNQSSFLMNTFGCPTEGYRARYTFFFNLASEFFLALGNIVYNNVITYYLTKSDNRTWIKTMDFIICFLKHSECNTEVNFYLLKLDGVDFVNNNPPLTNSTTLSEEEEKYIYTHVTCDMWHVTCDM